MISNKRVERGKPLTYALIFEKTMKKITLIILIVLVGVAILLPWSLYNIGLGNINGRPELPAQSKLAEDEAIKIWRELKEKDPIEVVKLNPYHFVLFLLGIGSTGPAPGERLAWFVARNHNYANLKGRRNLYWHLSGAALTVWLTRNWNADQLLAKAKEIQARQGKKSAPQMYEGQFQRRQK